jgi:hypothetical protein
LAFEGDAVRLRQNTAWTSYRIFGLTLWTDFPFVSRLAPGPASDANHTPSSATADLSFTCQKDAPLAIDREKEAGCDVFPYSGVADFYCFRDRIVCHLLSPAAIHLIEIIFLGEVLSFWLERHGIPALHASAVLTGRGAVAFLSSNHGGKSALAATLMQSGHPLVSDDILPVEEQDGIFACRPGYPTMRMWPDEAAHFLGAFEHLPLVHPELSKRRVPVGVDGFGSFCDTSQPLAGIYLPERRAGSGATTTSEIPPGGHPGRHPPHLEALAAYADIEILPVSPRDAVIELIRHSFSAHHAEAAGLAPQRLDFFARLAQKIAMRRLIYPAGFEHLPRVREAILGDRERTIFSSQRKADLWSLRALALPVA